MWYIPVDIYTIKQSVYNHLSIFRIKRNKYNIPSKWIYIQFKRVFIHFKYIFRNRDKCCITESHLVIINMYWNATYYYSHTIYVHYYYYSFTEIWQFTKCTYNSEGYIFILSKLYKSKPTNPSTWWLIKLHTNHQKIKWKITMKASIMRLKMEFVMVVMRLGRTWLSVIVVVCIVFKVVGEEN